MEIWLFSVEKMQPPFLTHRNFLLVGPNTTGQFNTEYNEQASKVLQKTE